VARIEIEYSKDGKKFITLGQFQPDATRFSWKPVDYGIGYYRVRVVTVADERAYYSKTIVLQDTKYKPVKLLSTIVDNSISIFTGKDYAYQILDESGRLLQQGQLRAGNNHVNVIKPHKGLLILRVTGHNEAFIYRLIKP
jgi:hypothetical protein